jgi:hypothetical protein
MAGAKHSLLYAGYVICYPRARRTNDSRPLLFNYSLAESLTALPVALAVALADNCLCNARLRVIPAADSTRDGPLESKISGGGRSQKKKKDQFPKIVSMKSFVPTRLHK